MQRARRLWAWAQNSSRDLEPVVQRNPRNAIHLAVEFFYLAALAGMWNLLAGYGGLVSIGQQAYVGIGGYSVVAFALLLGVNPFVSVFLGGVIAVAVSIPTAFVVFRLRGPHLLSEPGRSLRSID